MPFGGLRVTLAPSTFHSVESTRECILPRILRSVQIAGSQVTIIIGTTGEKDDRERVSSDTR